MKNTEELFYEQYTPFLNHFYNDENACSWDGCMYETYGEELGYIVNLANNPAQEKTCGLLWKVIMVNRLYVLGTI